MNKWKLDAITMDELSLMAEEEIADRVGKCRSEISKLMGNPLLRQKWEVELTYSQRELQIRQVRRNSHREYNERERVADARFVSEDYRLPEYDGNRIPRFVRDMLEWN